MTISDEPEIVGKLPPLHFAYFKEKTPNTGRNFLKEAISFRLLKPPLSNNGNLHADIDGSYIITPHDHIPLLYRENLHHTIAPTKKTPRRYFQEKEEESASEVSGEIEYGCVSG